MALMGMHYFHGAPQLSRSQGCRLIELDEWTVTWTKQVDPPLPPPRPPADSNSHLHVNAHIHTHKCGHAHRPMLIHIILKGESVQLQGETWQSRDQLSSRQMTRMWEAWSFFLPRFETLLLSAADNSSPPLQPSVYGTVHFKGTLITTLFGWQG